MLSIDGLATGIDTATIIEGLLSIQQKQIDLLTGRQQGVLEEQSAFKNIEARLISLQSKLNQLARAQNSVFEAKTVTSSNENLVLAAARESAVPGVFNIRVNSLARAHQIATQGFVDAASLVTEGTMDIRVGDGATTTVTIDGTNNTLQGLADAINNSGADATATVINDGSGGGVGYRILLSSKKTGTAGALTITNNLAASSGDAVKPLFAGGGTTASSIAAPVTGTNYGPAATPIANAGTGAYTGTDNDTYTFTFLETGRMGDHDIQIAYSDGSGDNTGTIDYKDTDAGSFVTIAEGVQIRFDPGGVAVAGSTFTVDVSVDTTSIGPAVKGPGYDAAVETTPESDEGLGSYNGPDDDTYTFTFLESGVIGRDNVLIAYSDGSGDNSGTVNYKKGHVGNFRNVAEGLRIKLDAGFVVAGETFTVDVTTADGNVAPAVPAPGYGAGSTPTANDGSGGYTGTEDDTYAFSVIQGGVVGEDTVQILYVDGSGDNTGTITLAPGDVDTFKTVAEGLQIKFDSGLLMQGDSFTIDVTAGTTTTAANVQDPTDASITFGTGPGALTIVNSTNQIEDVIPGVTLDLVGADVNQDVTITVGNDTETAKTAITDFVDSYNDLMAFIDDQVRFEAESEVAGALLGNRSAISIQDDVRSNVLEVVAGVSTEMNRLSALGISVTSTGRLTVDGSRLDQAPRGEVEGVSIDDVRRLFALDGQSDNGNIHFVVAGSNTKETATGYQVDIVQAAERARLSATNTLAASTVIDSSNNTLNITVDSKQSSTLTLTEGTYTREQLADHLESLINADTELIGRTVSVQLDGDRLELISETYGSSSQLAVGSGTALTALGFSGSESDTGLNVFGKFVVDGVEETATGSGRLLVGDASNANTAGLQLRVTMTSAQVQLGNDGTVTVSRGIASRLDQLLDSLMDPISGRVDAVNDGFDDTVAGIQTSIDRLNAQFESQQESLIAQFVALEGAVSELQSLSSYLTAQLASIPAIRAR